MKSRSRDQTGPGAIELIEEVFHLLRRIPPRVPAYYFFGSMPFVLGLLYFWAEMSKSAFAYQRLGRDAFVLALLFIWMKTWQAVYARELWAEVCGEDPPRWSTTRILRLAVRQAALQPLGLFLLPLALISIVPFSRTYALFQNMTVLDEGKGEGASTLARRAAELARPWQRQNLVLIWALSPYLMVTAAGFFLVIYPVVASLAPEWTEVMLGLYAAVLILLIMPLSPFGVVIAANIAMALLIFPQLLHSLLGVHTVFADNPERMLNSTFFAVVCGLTYLCMDPLMKAAYVLRCFYAKSINTGEDIRVQIKRFAGKAGAAMIVCALLAGVFTAGGAIAQESEDTQLSVSPIELNQALDEELKGRRYAWRMPRQPRSEWEPGPFGLFLGGIAETMKDWARTVLRWIKRIKKWLDEHMPEYKPAGESGRRLIGPGGPLRLVLYLLLAALLSIAGVYLYRIWKSRDERLVEVIAEAVRASPDIEDEATTGEDLPEDGWLKLAQEMMDKGELRLALRAAFLASLAHLAGRELIHIERFKSNRDYEHELKRFAHEQPEVLDIFSRSVVIYEHTWYGMHEATRELLERVLANQERLRVCGQEE